MEDEIEDLLDRSFKGRLPYAPDFHIKTAIREYKRELLITKYKNARICVEKSIRIASEKLHQITNLELYEIRGDSEYKYADLLSPVHLTKKRFKENERILRENFEISKDFTLEAVDMMLENISNVAEKGAITSKIKSLSYPSHLILWAAYRSLWELIRDTLADSQRDNNYNFKRIDDKLTNVKIFCGAEFTLIIDESRCWVFDYEQVLMITDTITSRYQAKLYCFLSSQIGFDYNPTEDQLQRIYDWGDSLLSELGNDAYDIIKQFEPLCIAAFLHNWEPLDLSKMYGHSLIEQAAEKPRKQQAMRDLYEILKTSLTHKNALIEIYGCYRHFGHPTVDELEGIASLRKNSTEKILIQDPIMTKIKGAFIRTFIIEYITKNKKWPKCHILPNANPSAYFGKIVLERSLAISEYDLSISLEDWASIEFEQNFQFDDYKDITMLLQDTALSPIKKNWTSVYCQDLLSVPHPTGIKESRRVLLEVLRRKDLSCKTIREIIQSRTTPEEWLIVGLHAKERELKIAARLFAMMTIEMRLYFAMTEKNLAEQVFPYIPHQTMTWSDAELTKVLLDLTGLSQSSLSGKRNKQGFVYVTISLDFNKFNQRWRPESTNPIFELFDQLFGTPGLYTYSHEFFQNAFFYLSSYHRPPEYLRSHTQDDKKTDRKPKDKYFVSETTWQGQDGGCEGLRQKGWTAIISAALAANHYETGYPSQIIGQGDNQVIVVSIPIPIQGMSAEEYIREHPTELSQSIQRYLNNLQLLTKGCGMDLKLEESYVSLGLLNYGKEIIINGSFAGSTLKKIGRTYPEVSEIYPTIQTRVSSIGTAALSACMKGFDIFLPILMMYLETLGMLHKELTYGSVSEGRLRDILQAEAVQVDKTLKESFLLIPSICGGLPIPPFPAFLYRGHPDLSTASLLWLKHLSKNYPRAERLLGMIVGGLLFEEKVDPVQLLQDPQSLNLKKSHQSSNEIKHMMVSKLSEQTQNPDIKIMLQACNEKSLKDLAEYLFQTDPLMPRVLNEFLRLSPDGSMLSFLSIFRDMRTMKQILGPSEAKTMVQCLKGGDQRLVRSIIALHKKSLNDRYLDDINLPLTRDQKKEWIKVKTKCITSVTNEIRNTSWGIEIQGVTTPHPLEYTHLSKADSTKCNPCCSGEELILYVVQEEGKDAGMVEQHFKRGTMRHYLGSGTSEKRSGPLIQFARSEKAIKSAEQLLRAKNWTLDKTDPDNTLIQFLDELISARTDASEEVLLLSSGTNYGGSIQHRFSDVTSKHESRPCIRVNFHSRISMSSDHLGKYARGRENYPIIFQACFLQALNQIHHLILYCPQLLEDGNISFHQHISCSSCLPVIVENPLRNHLKAPKVQQLRECPLIFASVSRDLSLIPINSLSKIYQVEPSPSDPQVRRIGCQAASLAIVGESHNLSTPVVHSRIRSNHREGTLTSLTIGFFLKQDLKILFQELSLIWLCDNLYAITKICSKMRVTLEEGIWYLLRSYPDNVWNVLKPFLCLQELRYEAREKLNMETSSTDMFITGKGLGFAISQAIGDLLDELGLSKLTSEQRKNKMKVLIITTTPGISLFRSTYIWMNSIWISTEWTTVNELRKLMKIGRKILEEATHQNYLNLSQIPLTMASLRIPNFSLKHCLTTHKMRLSRVGVEPWLAPSLFSSYKSVTLPAPAVSQPTIRGNKMKKLIWDINQQLGLMRDIDLHDPNQVTDKKLLPIGHTQKRHRSHTRTDHQFRLVGKYSTAFLKYCQIYSMIGLNSVKVGLHVAEGAGSICRASLKLLNAEKVIYNSLFQARDSYGHRSVDFLPAELQDFHPSVVLGPDICYQTGGDITKASTQIAYSAVISEYSKSIGVATCDAEFPEKGGIIDARDLLKSFLTLIRPLNPGTPIIFKTYCRIPEFLQHQVAIWASFVAQPRILVPKFSSNEATEVFLVGNIPKNLPQSNWSPLTISQIDLDSISSLSQLRVTNKLHFRSVTWDLLRQLFIAYHDSGFDFNVTQAIHIFLNFSISEYLAETNILKGCSTAIGFSSHQIEERFIAMRKLSKGEGLSRDQRMKVSHLRKDSADILRHMETIYNANLLRHLVLFSEIPNSFFESPWIYEEEGKTLFDYDPDAKSWVQKYGRSFYKIIGFLQIVKHQIIRLPPILKKLEEELSLDM